MVQQDIERLLRLLEEKFELQAGPDRIIREAEMYSITGLKRSQRDELIKRHEFPAPTRLAGEGGRAKGWFAREISAWQRRRRDERDAND